MRIALCLFGIVGGKTGRNGVGGAINPQIGYNFYNKTLPMDKVDVFIHSWSKDHEKQIKDIYQPRKALFEPQEKFEDVTIQNYGFDTYDELFEDPGNKIVVDSRKQEKKSTEEIKKEFDNLIFRSHSRWKSTMKSIQLKQEYEKENDFEYDCVVLGRFDIALMKKIEFSKINPNQILVAKRIGRVDSGQAVYDLIFAGGNEAINKFGHLFENIYKLPIRPPWAAKHHINNINVEEVHYFNNGTDYQLLRYNPQMIK